MNFEWITLNPILCIGWIIVGAVAGGLARNIMGRRDASFVQDIVLGLAGAAIGGLVAGLLLGQDPTAGAWGLERVVINLVISIVGALVLLFVGQAIFRRG